MDDHELQRQQRRGRYERKNVKKLRRRMIKYFAPMGLVLLLLIPLIFLSVYITAVPSDETTYLAEGQVVEVDYSPTRGLRPTSKLAIKLDNGNKYVIPQVVFDQYEDRFQGFKDGVTDQYVELRVYGRRVSAMPTVTAFKVNGEEIIGYDDVADTYKENRIIFIVTSVVITLFIEIIVLLMQLFPRRR